MRLGILADASSYGWLSLMPPVLAIALAIATRRVMLSLLLGLCVGTAILAAHQTQASFWLAWPSATLENLLWKNLADAEHLRVFCFTLMMGVMVTIMQRSGAMDSLVHTLSKVVKGRTSCQLMTWALGMVIFFDDYANTLLLGGSMRPLADRWRVSREKLAYLVDSTAAPVAGLAIVSTWVAGEIGYIEEGFLALPEAVRDQAGSGFSVFVQTIPYRFYVLGALLLAPLSAIFGRDLGAMWRAESRVLKAAPDQRRATSQASVLDTVGAAPSYVAILPVVIVVATTLWLLVETGRRGLSADASWFEIVGNGDSYLALFYGAMAGLAAAAFLARLLGALRGRDFAESIWMGIHVIMPPLGILWFAWSLSEVTDAEHLKTGAYLGQILETSVAAPWMPTVVFLVASATAFCTGTSWGTMGILTPLVVPVTYQMLAASGVASATDHPILIAAIGSVLAGAIFGDHCSPISDTTVLSSQASGCDHMAHVWTQMPYALLVAAISVVFGTIPIGFGCPLWLSLLAGSLGLAGSFLFLGKRYPP